MKTIRKVIFLPFLVSVLAACSVFTAEPTSMPLAPTKGLPTPILTFSPSPTLTPSPLPTETPSPRSANANAITTHPNQDAKAPNPDFTSLSDKNNGGDGKRVDLDRMCRT